MGDITKAKVKLKDAEEKFDILKRNRKFLDQLSYLECASTLKDNLSNDIDIQEACDVDVDISNERKELLERIHDSIVDVIVQISKDQYHVKTDSKVIITDLDEAKSELADIVDQELSKNIFAEKEGPCIFEQNSTCRAHIDTLHKVSNDCKSGKYRILLLGDFQSGKSTTLDALCDGRNISAIGNGSATSSTLIAVGYGEEEKIEITWRDEKRILEIIDFIKPYSCNFDWASFNIDSKDSRECLFGYIDDIRKNYNKYKIPQIALKTFMLVDIILKYYDTDDLNFQIEQTRDISDISRLTRFPKKCEEDWVKNGVNDFSIEEGVFAFIDKVECQIPSKTLKDLNSIIIDSPGLFNNPYDTSVTEREMKDAHAIVFLLTYEKAINQDAKGLLENLKSKYPDYLNKLFIINNINNLKDCDFYETNCKTINQIFGDEKKIYLFDARLSYLAQLKILNDEGKIKDSDFSHLKITQKRKPFGRSQQTQDLAFEELWNKLVSSYYDDIPDSPDCILDDSQFNEFLKELKLFINENEGYSMIFSNGLIPLQKEMSSIRSSLRTKYLEPYTNSYDELSQLWAQRISQANTFQSIMKDNFSNEFFEVSQNGLQSVCCRYTDEMYIKLFSNDFYIKLAKEIARVLYRHKIDLVCTKKLFKDKVVFVQRFKELSAPWIREVINQTISNQLWKLNQHFKDDMDSTIINLLIPTLEKIEVKLKSEWENLYKGDTNFSFDNYITIPKSLKSTTNTEINRKGYNASTLNSINTKRDFIIAVVAEVTTVTATLAAWIGGYIAVALCDPTGVSQILLAILVMGGPLALLIAPAMVEDFFVSHLSEKILPELQSKSKEGFKRFVQQQVETTLNYYIENLIVNIPKMQNERDVALANNPDKEQYCFKAVEAIQKIDSQRKIYSDFQDRFILSKTN